MAGGWAVGRIIAEGFRGINQAVTLDCGDHATLLLASNGKGKSSALGAIEWCLFGDLKYQSPENRTNDELVNMHGPAGKARVRLELVGDEGTLVIERTRAVRKRETGLVVTKPGGERLEDEDASSYLFRTLGLTFDDFYRAVFLHQESVRGLLTDEPRVRDEALDRLFGLEKLRDIAAAIPVSLVRDAIGEIQGKQQRATDKLSGAAQVAEQNRARYLRDAAEAGLDEAVLTFETAASITDTLRDKLEIACTSDGKPAVVLPEVKEIDDLEKAARKTKDTTKNLRLAGAAASPVDKATSRVVELQRLSKSLVGAKQALEEATTSLNAHRAALGENDQIEVRKTALRARLEELEKERQALGARSKVIGDALAYLKTVPTETRCPVCEQGIQHDHLLVSLQRRIEGTAREQQERIAADTTAATKELDQIADAEKTLLKLSRAAQAARDEVTNVEAKVKKAIPKPFTDAASALADEERSLISGLDALKEAASRREEALQSLDNDADRIRAVHKFLKADADFAIIRAKAQTETEAEAGSTLDDELEGLLGLEDSLAAVAAAIAKVSRERAAGAVEGSRDGVSQYYKRLCNHPYFDGIRIEVEDKSVRGVQKNSYTIRTFSTHDGKDSLASSRLSTGQMNCVALSVYLALREVLTHNLGFVILDDPSQNLDTEHKEALAELLAELKPSTQLLIASQDEEFQRLLLAKLDGKGTKAYDLAWNPRKGASLTPRGAGR